MVMAGILDESRMAYHIKSLTERTKFTPLCSGHSDHMVPLEEVRVGPGTLKDSMPLSEQKTFIMQEYSDGL